MFHWCSIYDLLIVRWKKHRYNIDDFAGNIENQELILQSTIFQNVNALIETKCISFKILVRFLQELGRQGIILTESCKILQ